VIGNEAGNQRTCSRAFSGTSEAHTGAAAMTSILLSHGRLLWRLSRTKPRHPGNQVGSANWRITPSPMRPACAGPWAVAGDPDAGKFAIGPGNFGGRHRGRPFCRRSVAEDADEFLEVFECGGFFPSTRRELSPRPMPSSMRPCEARLRVANRLAETVTSRTAGFVTQVPRRIFLVLAAMSVRAETVPSR